MNNPRLAGRYAKSLLGLAQEQNQLDVVFADMKMLQQMFKDNRDFVAILTSPVIPAEKKEKIIASVTTGRISPMTVGFITLLIKKTREQNFPEIVNAFLQQYNKLKNIHQIKVTTAVPISKEMEDSILAQVRKHPKYQNVELQSVVKEELIGGYKFEMDDILIDASILRDLNDVKKQFRSNEYIHNIR